MWNMINDDNDEGFAPGTRAYYRSLGGEWSTVTVVCAEEPTGSWGRDADGVRQCPDRIMARLIDEKLHT